MQLTYDQKAAASVAGMMVDVGSELLPGATRSAFGPTVKSINVDVAAVQNSTLYRITVSRFSNASATYGQTITTNIDFTSDGSATEAEIHAGLLAAVNASPAPVSAKLVDAALGPLLVYADQAATDFTLTLTANLSQAAETGEIPFGVAVVMDGAEDKCRLPQVAADIGNKTLGVSRLTLAQENNLSATNVYPTNSQINMLRKGRIWVKVEETVAAGDDAWVRVKAVGGNTQPGAFRKSVDGTAQVITYTPSAANATPYVVSVGGYSYEYLSDGTATAAEIVTDLLAQVNLQTSLHGVTATGSTTLILTGLAGLPFDYSASANMVAVVTTAVAQAAAKLAGAKFMSAASAAGLAILELNL